ncbi:hypothetical protein EAO70_12960 [Streptomyces sp. adm13(2018)]|uniref:hypothetical protein n=1 Tax=Streptomyces sp. adm13(2018) TaxID=2479007 RepID=UPI0011CEA70A|nr:hypothetical protein [Streptomyces sp. adm13(2018)]TXS16342.1 hypothetical protein EAO70_12960 [Streptomyces sp. adm13(2018)]
MAANQAEVDLIVNAAGALPDLEQQLSQIVRTAEDGAPEVDVQASLAVQNSLAVMSTQLDQVLRNIDANDPSIDVEAALDAQASLRNLRQDLDELTRAAARGTTDIIELEAALDFPRSLAEVTEAITDLVNDVEAAAPEIDLEVDVDTDQVPRAERVLRALGRTSITTAKGLGTVTKGVAALSLAVGGGAQALAGLVAALQQVAPAAAVGTQAILAQKLATGTLKLAMVGVQDAIQDAFDPDISVEDFHKSLKTLAPEAALFVDEIHTIRRELKALQQGVQNRVFKDFDELFRALSRDVGPDVSRALNQTAGTFNRMAKEVGIAALALDKQGVLGQALDGATTGLQNLEQVPARLATAFGLLAAASAPAFDRITAAVDRVAASMVERLQQSFASGELEEAINKAVDTIGQLLGVVANFGQAIGNIFGGLTQNGRGLFQILEDISVAFENLTASQEFQTILGELAATADALVQNILPLIQEAFVQLGPVIEELAPVVRDFVAAIGPELIPIIQELGPILVDLALIMREQLPLAIDLANAAIDAIVIALQVLGVAMDVARQGSEKFADFYHSDFIESFRAASNAAVTHRDILKSAFIDWTSSAYSSIRSFQNALGDFSASLRDRLTAAVIESLGSMLRALRSFIGEFVHTLATLPSRAYDIGVQIMAGLAGGLTSGIGRIIGIARNIADSVTSTIKGALDIRSPSKVTDKLGSDTAKGFSNGLEREGKKVKKVAKQIANEVKLAFADGTTPVSDFARSVKAIDTSKTVKGMAAESSFTQRLTLSGQGTSVVNVFLDGKLYNQIIDSRIKINDKKRDRIAAQGVRV